MLNGHDYPPPCETFYRCLGTHFLSGIYGDISNLFFRDDFTVSPVGCLAGRLDAGGQAGRLLAPPLLFTSTHPTPPKPTQTHPNPPNPTQPNAQFVDSVPDLVDKSWKLQLRRCAWWR
jgi:hypothetical protein